MDHGGLILKLSHHFKGLLLCLYDVVCINERLSNFFCGSGVAFDQNRLIFIFAVLLSLLLVLLF
jgi:hypothetical protein